MSELLDAVIVGEGQDGLGISYFLQRDSRKHVIFERERIGEPWLSQRWDSFQLNTPNFMNALPGFPYPGTESDGFWRQDELVAYFQDYVGRFWLPVQTGVRVVSLEQEEDNSHFLVKTRADGRPEKTVECRSVELYFIRFPCLSKRNSGTVYGIEGDAQYIANFLAEQLA